MSKNTDLGNYDTSLPVINIVATGTITVGNATVNSIINSSGFTGNGSGITSVNAVALGGKTESALNVNSSLTSNSTTYIIANTGLISNATGVYINTTYIGTLTANNATNLNEQPASYYTNATNITTGTLPYAQIPANIVNTTAAFSISGIYTHTANIVVNTAIIAGGNSGTAGQVLTSNGAGNVYWSTIAGVNTSAQYTFSNTITFSNTVTLANGTANTAGIYDSLDNLRSIPFNNQTTAYTLAASDNGKTVSTNAGITVNGALLSANQIFTIFNNSAASITITAGANATIYLGGTATTGNRTLAQRGLATLICYAANSFVISGVGLT